MSEAEYVTRECPFCKEEVKAEAVRCKHCHATILPTEPGHKRYLPILQGEHQSAGHQVPALQGRPSLSYAVTWSLRATEDSSAHTASIGISGIVSVSSLHGVCRVRGLRRCYLRTLGLRRGLVLLRGP